MSIIYGSVPLIFFEGVCSLPAQHQIFLPISWKTEIYLKNDLNLVVNRKQHCMLKMSKSFTGRILSNKERRIAVQWIYLFPSLCPFITFQDKRRWGQLSSFPIRPTGFERPITNIDATMNFPCKVNLLGVCTRATQRK